MCFLFLDTALVYSIQPAYGDAVYTPAGTKRPNALDISEALSETSKLFIARGSYRNLTAFFVTFGKYATITEEHTLFELIILL